MDALLAQRIRHLLMSLHSWMYIGEAGALTLSGNTQVDRQEMSFFTCMVRSWLQDTLRYPPLPRARYAGPSR